MNNKGDKKMERIKGTVTWFNDAKGYGFIRSDEVEGDIFLHYSAITTDGFKTVTEGAIVEFDVINGVKGKTAVNMIQLVAGIPLED